jgi:hypothetical protein
MAQLSFGDSFDGPPSYGCGITVIHVNGIAFALLYAMIFAHPFERGL